MGEREAEEAKEEELLLLFSSCAFSSPLPFPELVCDPDPTFDPLRLKLAADERVFFGTLNTVCSSFVSGTLVEGREEEKEEEEEGIL